MTASIEAKISAHGRLRDPKVGVVNPSHDDGFSANLYVP